jgi:fermentation-respiration switch protein FrsA (DUF1100 family)
MKKAVRNTAAGVFILLMLFVGGGGFYLLDYSLSPTMNKGKEITESYEVMFAEYPFLKPWVDSLRVAEALRDTFIYNADSIRLHALYIPAPRSTTHTAVVVHGYTDNAVRMLMIGYMYHKELQYNVLLPDLQHSGLSDGDAIGMGWKDRLDVLRWMQVANERFGGTTEMVVHGISMGAATTMMVSGEILPPYVKCFVEDCGYTSVWTQFAKELKEQFHLPAFPLLHAASALCRLRYGWSFAEASALAQVSKCTLPMLFIHGSNDRYVPTDMVYPLYEAKPAPKELWIVEGAAHAESYLTNPAAYTEKVRNFVRKYIN